MSPPVADSRDMGAATGVLAEAVLAVGSTTTAASSAALAGLAPHLARTARSGLTQHALAIDRATALDPDRRRGSAGRPERETARRVRCGCHRRLGCNADRFRGASHGRAEDRGGPRYCRCRR